MLKLKRVFLICVIIFISLAITVSGQENRRGGRGNSMGRGAGNRGTTPTAPADLDRTLLNGTLRFQTGGVNMYLVVGKEKPY